MEAIRAVAAPLDPGPAQTPVLIRAHGLSKTYVTSSGEVTALKGLDFEIYDGEFVSVVGQSGCGKSTLLKLLAGLLPFTAGSVELNGRPLRGPTRETAVVFQSPVLLPWRTVLDNVLFPVELLKLPRAKYRERAMELLMMAKIEDFAGHLPRQLSGGMRQRTAICRALVHDPSILLMDEPFSALDAITRDEMGVELLRIWQANRKTVIFVTHSIREAVFLSDRVIVMGRRPAILMEETPIDLPRPRDIAIMESEPFNVYVRQLRKAIEVSHAQ